MIHEAIVALLLTASPPTSPDARSSSDAADKVSCRRVTDNGPIPRVRKICRTESEWKALRDKTNVDPSDLPKPSERPY